MSRAGWSLACLLLAAWSCLAWAAPACVAPEGGIGGTGAPTLSGGIGGTGGPQASVEGGMGGTGIVGTITGFASVCVNGLEVHFDPATPVRENGRPANVGALALGQVISVHAVPSDRGWVAREMDILNMLEGPVTRVRGAAEGDVIEVMGQPVRIVDATRLAGWATATDAAPGASVKVSGHRNDAGEVVATRIEAVRALTEVSVIGLASRDETGRQMISGMPVLAGEPLRPGAETLARGVWEGARLRVATRRDDPSLPFIGRVERVIVEGIVLAPPAGNVLRIGGFDVAYSHEALQGIGGIGSVTPGQRIIVTGRIEAGRRLQAIRIERIRPAVAERPASARPATRIQRPPSMTRPERPMRVMPRSVP